MSDETKNMDAENIHAGNNDAVNSDVENDLLCADCDDALAAFLQDMADHNAKITACPKCGKHHPLKPAKRAKPSSETGLEAA